MKPAKEKPEVCKTTKARILSLQYAIIAGLVAILAIAGYKVLDIALTDQMEQYTVAAPPANIPSDSKAK